VTASRQTAAMALACVMLLPGGVSADEASAVFDIERLFAAPDVDGPTVRGLRFSPDSERVTFLRGKQDDPLQFDLWEYDLEDRRARLLVDSAGLLDETEELSAAEAARRERLRIAAQRGIVAYAFSPDGRSLLFPLGGDLYLYGLQDGSNRRLTENVSATDPKFSSSGRYVSFVSDQDLHVTDLGTGDTRALTTGGGGTLHNAEAEFIAQEEMDRYTGYWWSPDESQVAFIQVDESPVRVAERFEVHAEEVRIYRQRYPATGTPNARVRLGVVDVGSGDIRWMDLGGEEDIYIARVDWFPDGEHLAVQRQSRDQQTLDLLKVDVASGESRTLLTETSDTWVNLHNSLAFLEEQPRFVWLSERSGHAHLYLYTNDGEPVRQLTSGDWDVVDGARARSALLHVDEEAGKLYFTATLATPIERNVYAVSLDGGGEPVRISRDAGWHIVDFAPNGQHYVDSFDSVTTPPRVSVHRADGTLVGYIEENRLNDDHPYAPYLDSHPTTEFGELEAEDGQTLFYRMKKPADFDEARQYPVALAVYGGPQGQRVVNRWSAGFEEILTRNGYLVFSLDNRGTGFRGVAFDRPLYGRLGNVEVRDQLVGIDYLRSLPWVDAGNIGVFGSSYGGYMALMCLFQHPDAFAAGVAAAPVTDWALYDTHYTERFLGTPAGNPDGYEKSGVFPYAGALQDPLLLIHGMADDNVLFTHSTKLFKVLQDDEKSFDIMTYPGAKHGLTRVPGTARHVYAHILRFFDRHLK
jgi:dipeptidyl-peptidase-4